MAKQKQQSVIVKRDEKNPQSMELIADSIIEISKGFRRLSESRLKQRVIVLLIKDLTGVSMGDIEKVLNAAQQLEKQFIKPISK